MKVVAIIPARGGSKRIPRKNIRLFNGLPIIAWSIQAAIKSGCFDRVIVSTDDKEIASIANSHGAETPFIRPKNISDDYAATSDVVAHAIRFERDQGSDIEYVCCIYPTAPFINIDNLKKGLDIIKARDYDYVFSATSYAFPVGRAFSFNSAEGVQMIFPENEKVRSQDLEDAFHDAGQFYWSQSQTWVDLKPIFSPKSFPLILPRYEVVDIDSEEDWNEAEMKCKLLHKHPV